MVEMEMLELLDRREKWVCPEPPDLKVLLEPRETPVLMETKVSTVQKVL